MPATAKAKVLDAIADVPREAWNALVAAAPRATPFMDWRWLEALEAARCVGGRTGWTPRHLTVWDGSRLVAAAPAYLKDHSDGDFARDWDWADAARRAGIRYYPKLSITVPFTPVTGSRLLFAPDLDEDARAEATRALLALGREVAEEAGARAIQILFPDEDEAARLESHGLAVRLSYQYHWRNEGYVTPADFLARLDAKRRHQQRRERAAPPAQGIAIRTIRDAELAADPIAWARTAYALHTATIDKLPWGRGWLNQRFYERAVAAMPEHVELVVAERAGRVIAGAFNLASPTHLWGRYWGAFEEHRFLHFNVCCYHSIDECIRIGRRVFEGGAGGEHKLARGFEPAETYSAHLLLDRRFDAAVRRHLAVETTELRASIARWRAESPVLRHAPRGADTRWP